MRNVDHPDDEEHREQLDDEDDAGEPFEVKQRSLDGGRASGQTTFDGGVKPKGGERRER